MFRWHKRPKPYVEAEAVGLQLALPKECFTIDNTGLCGGKCKIRVLIKQR